MAAYRKVLVRVWGDQRFDALSAPPPNAQTLWLYLLTGPETQVIPGVIRAGVATLSEGLRWKLTKTRSVFEEILSAHMAVYDENHRVIWLPKALELPEHAPVSINQVKAWAASFCELPATFLLTDIKRGVRACLTAKHAKFLAAWDAKTDGIGDGIGDAKGYPVPVLVKEQDQDPAASGGIAICGNVENSALPHGARSTTQAARVITALVRTMVAEDPSVTGSDLKEAAKSRCAQLGLPYDARLVNIALDAVEHIVARVGA